jgi:hypothetical protein
MMKPACKLFVLVAELYRIAFIKFLAPVKFDMTLG